MAQRMGASADASTPGGSRLMPRARAPLGDDEIRRLLARELHDRVAQTLTSMLIDLENFKVEQAGREGVLRHVDTLQDSTRGVLNSLREVLYELRSGPGVEESLLDALGALVGRFQEKTHIDTKLSILPGWPARITPPAALNLYRIIEEALANVRQHSGANAVQITLQPYSENALSVCVSDDGRGHDLADPGPTGMGVVGMKERALYLGAQLLIETVIGSGTTVRVIVPRERL